MPQVAVVTDSTATLPVALADDLGIVVVPMQVVVGAKAYRDGVDPEASPENIAAALKEYLPVSTSRPSPAALLEVYEQAAAGGADEVVSVHVSAEVSATYESALLAAKESPVPVHAVDSRQIGALAAAAAAAAGRDGREAAEAARRRAEDTVTLFYVDTLEYLRRGGRVGAAAALIGSALAVKPILQIVDGRIAPLEKVRTAGRALARLEELAVAAASDRPVAVTVSHLAGLANAQALAGSLTVRIADGLGGREVRVCEVPAVVGAHVGPGLVGVTIAPG
jgi:DegV family protein with EDD domain